MDLHLIESIFSLVRDSKWWALAAVVIGLIVRLLKSDTPIPITVPARWRPWLAIALGIVGACIEKVSQGTPWEVALGGGLVAAFAAISSHELFVESLRGGREVAETKTAFIRRSLAPKAIPGIPDVLIAPYRMVDVKSEPSKSPEETSTENKST